ncbi:MAG: hypothetical protein MUO43_15025, partial [Desulfobacterales bacterium]|nr:hypothetical protein [Desulfobacterales bacterium]
MVFCIPLSTRGEGENQTAGIGKNTSQCYMLRGNNYQSRTRNKLIAEAFYLTKDIEKYGSGYIRIRLEISAYSTMKFDYEENGDGFLVKLSYAEQKISSGGVNDLLDFIR